MKAILLNPKKEFKGRCVNNNTINNANANISTTNVKKGLLNDFKG